MAKRSLPKGMSFEEAFNRLGEVVQSLESGGLTLRKATELYEDGINLAQVCNKLLNEAELRVTELKISYSEYSSDQSFLEEE